MPEVKHRAQVGGNPGCSGGGPPVARPASSPMRWTLAVAAGIGALAVIDLVMHVGWQRIVQTISVAGFGLLWLVPLRLLTVGFDTRGWRVLLKVRRQASWALLFWLGMVRDAVNTLLPVARVGGEVIAIRLLGLRGVKTCTASASVIVETSVTLVWQVVLTVAGIVALLPYVGASFLVPKLLSGLAFGVIVVVVFLLIQWRIGLVRFFERLTGRFFPTRRTTSPVFRSLDQKVRVLYRQRSALLRCAMWQLFGFVASAAEIFFLAYLMQVPLSMTQVFIFEALIQALHSVSFAVPGALGIQEGGFVLLGSVFGMAPDVALSLALCRRGRQIVLGVPVLVSWRWFEGRHKRRESQEGLAALRAASG